LPTQVTFIFIHKFVPRRSLMLSPFGDEDETKDGYYDDTQARVEASEAPCRVRQAGKSRSSSGASKVLIN
jgi:hypothetical protein